MDSIVSINIRKDSSLAMLPEAQCHGYEIRYMETVDLCPINGEVRAHTRILGVEQNHDEWYEFRSK